MKEISRIMRSSKNYQLSVESFQPTTEIGLVDY